MTLCIAAHAATGLGEPRIVLCSDWLVGDEVSTTEHTNKCYLPFLPSLSVMFSGRIEDVEDLIRLYKVRASKNGPANIATYEALKEELWQGMKEFRDWLRRCGRPRGHTDVDLLVCGFLQGIPLIVHVNKDSVTRIAGHFYAIGTGAWAAEISMRFRVSGGPYWPSNLREMLYFCYEAKRMGEMSPSVGKLTSLSVLEPIEGGLRLSGAGPDVMNVLSDEFARYGPQPFKGYGILPWHVAYSSRATLHPEATKAGLSLPQPSPGSLGEIDES